MAGALHNIGHPQCENCVRTLPALNALRGRRARKVAAPADTVVVYLRVSTSEQATSSLRIETQSETARAYAERKGLTIVEEFRDEGISAKALSGRPGALAALAAVRDRTVAGILVAKMDRLSRSVLDGAGLMEAAQREGGALHFADLDIDTSTLAGAMAANIIISGSQYERRLISQRTSSRVARRARPRRTPWCSSRTANRVNPVGLSAKDEAAVHTKRLLKVLCATVSLLLAAKRGGIQPRLAILASDNAALL